MTHQQPLVLPAGTYLLVRDTLGTRWERGHLAGMLPYPPGDKVIRQPAHGGDNWDLLFAQVPPGQTYQTAGLGFMILALGRADPIALGQALVAILIALPGMARHYLILKIGNPVVRMIWQCL